MFTHSFVIVVDGDGGWCFFLDDGKFKVELGDLFGDGDVPVDGIASKLCFFLLGGFVFIEMK